MQKKFFFLKNIVSDCLKIRFCTINVPIKIKKFGNVCHLNPNVKKILPWNYQN